MPPFHTHPDVLVLLALLAGGYAWAVRRIGPRHVSPGDPAASRGQVALYFAGVGAMAAATMWPLHDLGERSLFTAHMIQHLLLTFVGPPLMLAGTPGWMLRALLRPRWLLALVRRLSRPFLALFLFNGLILLIHWPAFVDLYLRSSGVHFLVHLSLVGAALVMWMPVLSPIFEIPRISQPAQMLYLFGQSILPTVPASFLTFGSEPLYRFYAEAPRIWGLDAITDQRIAGLSMKLLGGLILWGVIAVLFFRWAKADETGLGDFDVQQVERELHGEEVPG